MDRGANFQIEILSCWKIHPNVSRRAGGGVGGGYSVPLPCSRTNGSKMREAALKSSQVDNCHYRTRSVLFREKENVSMIDQVKGQKHF